MKNILQRIAGWLQDFYGKIILSTFLVALVLITAVSGVLSSPSLADSSLRVLVGLLMFGVLWEIVVRIVLYGAYGPEYRWAVFLYFLVDHPVYGNALRAGSDTKKIDFPIFDKVVFPVGAGRIVQPEKNKAMRRDVTINSLGFIGGEFSPKKKKGTLRIFCSGGSTTAGCYLDTKDAWPAQLEKLFKDGGYDVEVINAGVHGWFSYQEFLRFRHEIVNYETDVVLLHQGWNEESKYSFLSLGKKWKPRMVRNVREARQLYTPPSRVLSSSRLIGVYLAVQSLLKHWIFIPNTRFENPKRWEVLTKKEYLLAWFDVLVDSARLAKEHGILLYTLDYPGLSQLSDSGETRALYIANSRLTPLYADYQAVSKQRISRTLRLAEACIPLIDTDTDFSGIKGQERLALFYDEIHPSEKGNEILAASVFKQLIASEDFRSRYALAQGGFASPVTSNVHLEEEAIVIARTKLEENPAFLSRFILEKSRALRKEQEPRVSEVPEDRYTTF